MSNWSPEVLEFESLRQLVAARVQSPLGRPGIAAMEPIEDRAVLAESHADLAEALAYVRTAASPQPASRGSVMRLPLGGVPPVEMSVHKLRIEGAALEPREIADLVTFLDIASDVRSILQAVPERFPRLARRGDAIASFRSLLEDLEGRILPDGTLADHASPALNRIRREIERQKKAISDSLERFLRAHRDEGVLQEEFVTIRNERFVVPVIPGARRRIEGVVHGSSSSGHTLFVEPLETIELNNSLVRLSDEENREVHRILLEMTERMRAYAEPVRAAMATLAELDCLFAKARFGLDFQCAVPRFSDEAQPRLLLKNARHPLLVEVLRRRGGSVRPISVELAGRTRTLLISGPNTGGKTVTLKTVGLLALMAQCGLPVPAEEAEFPVFEQILADIGDLQSIEQSLSTFSAHIAHIREMLLDVTPASLVLMDELGAATDPEEGGALGVAFLDHFRASGAFTLASTHLLPLKTWGANTEGVLNGSMGFNDTTLEPTYELRLGLPGKSAGLDIAARLGLPETVMNRARQALTNREQELSSLLAGLHKQREENEQMRLALERRATAMHEEHVRLQREVEKREAARLRSLETQAEEALARFEQNARETIQRLEAAGDRRAADQVSRQTARVRREYKEDLQSSLLAAAAGASAPPKEAVRPKLAEGSRVRLQNIKDPARVLRLLSGNRIEVQAGMLKMQIPEEDIVEVLPEGAAPAAKLPRNVSFQPAPKLNPGFQEINVIGKTAEEACDEVERFLDNAVMATATRVRVIHGHGMGILKRAIGELLTRSPHVARSYPAPSYEGGNGATIVELREM